MVTLVPNKEEFPRSCRQEHRVVKRQGRGGGQPNEDVIVAQGGVVWIANKTSLYIIPKRPTKDSKAFPATLSKLLWLITWRCEVP
jgi:hypothetical protein